jgi:hypothetical protein
MVNRQRLVGLAWAAGTAATAMAQTWNETTNGGGDAGALPASAQTCTGTGPLTTITGVNGSTDADMYALLITDPAAFSASTQVQTTWDTMLWLFDAAGYGVTADDDSDNGYQSRITGQFIFSPGLYYLAISHYYYAPTDAYPVAMWFTYSPEHRPDGGGQFYPIAGWEGISGDGGAYTIALTGAALVPAGPAGACCLSNGMCSPVSSGACAALSGVYQGPGTVCGSANCPQPPSGACCLPNMTCEVLSQAYCGFRAGVFQGVGSACAKAGCTLAWIEQGDAGDLPATAQAVTGSGPIPGITGTLRDIMDADMFQIRICDAAAFSADTVNAGMTFDDTQLFLFDNAGRGVVFDDDDPQLIGYHSHISAQLVPGNGLYYLAISSWDEDPVGALTGQPIWEDAPYNLERPPDGPAAAEAIGGWDGGGYYAGQYLITLTAMDPRRPRS